MEEGIIVYFVGYENDIQKALKTKIYLDFDRAAKVYRRATNIVCLEGIRLFQAKLTQIEQILPEDNYKLLKSL